MARPAAPQPLDLVESFLNTYDIEGGADAIASVEGLGRWLSEHGFGGEPAGSDVGRARAVREGLRALLETHSGAEVDRRRMAELEGALASSRVTIGLIDGEPGLTSEGGLDAAFAALVTAIVQGRADGTWQRLKVCRDAGCRWVFYDRSKNRSGAWCDMAVCGGRSKVRAYRARRSARESVS